MAYRISALALYTPQESAALRPDTHVSAKVLTATHPIYDQFINRWLQFLDLYEGENLGKYIHRHARESSTSHEERVKRISYRNFCAPVVDLYVHYLFSKPIIRTAGEQTVTIPSQRKREPPAPRQKSKLTLIQGGKDTAANTIDAEWERWLLNVDRNGNTIDRFMADVARFAFIFGHMFVVADMPRIDTPPRTEAQRRQLKLEPYLVYYFPTEVPNWDLDDQGQPLWVRLREFPSGAVGPFGEQRTTQMGRTQKQITTYADPTLGRVDRRHYLTSRPVKARYRTWTRDRWVVHDVDRDRVELVAEGRHNLGQVPLVSVYNRRYSRYPFVGQSLISDVSLLNTEILNLDSLINEAVYQSVINILVLGRQPQDAEEIIIGANNVLEYAGDKPPYFLTPSTAPLAYMESRIQGMREEIYRLAKLGGGLGLEPRSVPSGVAAAFEFNETNKVLAERGDELESAEDRIHDLWYQWMGTQRHGLIDYPDDFSVQSFEEELRLATQTKQSLRSPTARREMEKRVAKRILHNVSEETLERIVFETDVVPDSVESFSGPVFYDSMSQQVKQPGTGSAPVGVLGQLYEETQQQQGVPEEEIQEQGEDAPPSQEEQESEQVQMQQRGEQGQQLQQLNKQQKAKLRTKKP